MELMTLRQRKAQALLRLRQLQAAQRAAMLEAKRAATLRATLQLDVTGSGCVHCVLAVQSSSAAPPEKPPTRRASPKPRKPDSAGQRWSSRRLERSTRAAEVAAERRAIIADIKSDHEHRAVRRTVRRSTAASEHAHHPKAIRIRLRAGLDVARDAPDAPDASDASELLGAAAPSSAPPSWFLEAAPALWALDAGTSPAAEPGGEVDGSSSSSSAAAQTSTVPPTTAQAGCTSADSVLEEAATALRVMWRNRCVPCAAVNEGAAAEVGAKEEREEGSREEGSREDASRQRRLRVRLPDGEAVELAAAEGRRLEGVGVGELLEWCAQRLAWPSVEGLLRNYAVVRLDHFPPQELEPCLLVGTIAEAGLAEGSLLALQRRAHTLQPPSAARCHSSTELAAPRACASPGCGFAATWHGTHCCVMCSVDGSHGPLCERKCVVRERCAASQSYPPQGPASSLLDSPPSKPARSQTMPHSADTAGSRSNENGSDSSDNSEDDLVDEASLSVPRSTLVRRSHKLTSCGPPATSPLQSP